LLRASCKKRAQSKCGRDRICARGDIAVRRDPRAGRRLKLAQLARAGILRSRESAVVNAFGNRMPTEKSLQRSRPRQRETPACQARRASGTNCSSSPSR
jgi:hypothetical protein